MNARQRRGERRQALRMARAEPRPRVRYCDGGRRITNQVAGAYTGRTVSLVYVPRPYLQELSHHIDFWPIRLHRVKVL